jgi:CheY-like chemotaxis protein
MVGPVSPEHREYLGDILTSSRHLLQLINDVLDLAKVESGKMEFRPEPVDLTTLVAEVRDILRGLAAGKRLRIEIDIEPDVRHVIVDPARVKQILYNYLSNAIKFTPEEGRIQIRVNAEGPLLFRIEVEDTGVGISAQNLGQLFVEFQQLDASAAKQYQGTGLGLALTKRVAEAHGGRVSVQSTLGVGSTFAAILPRLTTLPPPNMSDAGFIHPAVKPNGRAILVIEDDPRDRDWLVGTLAAAGYEVTYAATGADAIQRCREQPFHAITVDLLLPDMHAWELIEKIRSAPLHRATPMIAVTVSESTAPRSGVPVQDYLVKPIANEQLLLSLERVIRAPLAGRRILVIDDDISALKVADVTLKQAGYEPTCVSSAEDGLRTIAVTAPALIVVDLLMPGMDGLEFINRVRQMPDLSGVPVIVWTVKDLTADERRRLELSMATVVSKHDGGASALLEELRRTLHTDSV